MDIKDVENLAELARIDLSEEEKTQALKDMERILGYVKQIEEVKVPEDILKEYSLKNVWREDEVKSWDFSIELIKEQFPDSQDDFLKVKKIL
jgi:aspartyl-tRNA(Asn)/glutamyl-tRNA(Gln) amidotransferase subunit C